MTDTPAPPPPPPRRMAPQRFALLTALAGLTVAAVLFILVANNLGSGGSDSETDGEADTDLFVVGDASVLADAVARDGPLLLPDLLGGSRDIFLQHLGGDNWRAFESHPPGAARRCVLRWTPATRTFADSCGPTTYPADGAGLVNYPTRVDKKGRVLVDLRNPMAPNASGTTTSAPS